MGGMQFATSVLYDRYVIYPYICTHLQEGIENAERQNRVHIQDREMHINWPEFLNRYREHMILRKGSHEIPG